MKNSETLLQVENLSVSFPRRDAILTAVNEVSFTLERGERLGLVGESGAGKSVTGFSILNLVSKPGFISGGQVMFEGQDLTKLPESRLRSIRGDRISMIFQDPMMTLNPVLTIGSQMVECLMAHRRITKKEAERLAVECLGKVYIPSPEKRLQQYPHQLSGGMRQRVVIAIALLTNPSLIIADEPTTALDVTIQAEIMELLVELCDSERMGLILITHDLGVVAQMTHKIAVMYAGRIVETGPTMEVIGSPLHPYTQGLLAALPQNVDSSVQAEEAGDEFMPGKPKKHRLNQIPGVMPSLSAIPEGCSFNPRCSFTKAECLKIIPQLLSADEHPGRSIACHMVNKYGK